jgi:hypothetical protein
MIQRPVRLLLAALTVSGAATVIRPERAAAAPTVFHCTNTESGAKWSLRVDFDHGTADSYPATITAREISWHDTADQAFYTLNRATGDLKILRASSMGGWEHHDVCRPG